MIGMLSSVTFSSNVKELNASTSLQVDFVSSVPIPEQSTIILTLSSGFQIYSGLKLNTTINGKSASVFYNKPTN